MSEMTRVQRWRQQQREAGKDALTIWLPRELKLYVEDIALKRHCSPSDLIQQALTTCYPLSADVTGTVTDTSVTDTSQLRLMLQQELRAFFAHAENVIDAIHTAQHVTDTVTDTLSPSGHAPCVTDTVTDTEAVTDTVTDTASAPTAKRQAPSRQRAVTDTVTVTSQALESFDTAKYVLGKLCPRGHAWESTGQSLLRRTNRHCCACDREKFQERGKVQRQARRQQRQQERQG